MVVPVQIVLCDWAGYPLFRKKPMMVSEILCGTGAILENMAQQDAGCPFQVTLVINGATPRAAIAYKPLKKKYPFIRDILFRKSNRGFDFGGYDLAYQRFRKKGYHGDVVLMNSGVAGPDAPGWLMKYQEFFHSTPGIGLLGVSMNSHFTLFSKGSDAPFSPHVQSYFLYSNMAILEKVFAKHLPGRLAQKRAEVIRAGELGISNEMLQAGYRIGCMMLRNAYGQGELWQWPTHEFRFSVRYFSQCNRL